MKKLIAAALTVIMLVSIVPCAFAAEVVDSGSCGDSATWTLDSDGVLTIAGTGKMTKSFEGDDRITSVVIGDGITSICDGAFGSCWSLTKAVIPGSVKTLGEFAFNGDDQLTELTLSEGLKTIKDGAFCDCGFETVSLPSTVTAIGEGAFQDCMNLKSFTLPPKVTTVSPQLLEGCAKLAEVTLHDGVTSIGYNAFMGCGSLTELEIPDSVTEIGLACFERCVKLEKVNIPDGVEIIDNDTFYHCEKLTSLDIPASVKVIGRTAMGYCYALETVRFGGHAPSFDPSVFEASNHVTAYYPDGDSTWDNARLPYRGKVNWVPYDPATGEPVGVEPEDPDLVAKGQVGPNVNWRLTTDGTLTVSGTGKIEAPSGKDYSWYSVAADIKQVVIGEGITSIGFEAFNRYWFTEISLPDSLAEIGKRAFCLDYNLTSVTIPAGVKTIGAEAFGYCQSLTRVIFTGDAPVLDETAFIGVRADVYVPMNNDTWTAELMQSLSGFTWYVYDPNYVPSVIDSGTVGGVKWDYYDDGVLDITGTGSIPDYTEANPAPWAKYREDTNTVYIDEGITAVGANAFTGFTELAEIYFLGDAPEIADNAFTGVDAYAVFYIFENGWTAETCVNYGGHLYWVYMYLYGDVNVDGERTNADLVMLARYIVGLYDEDSDEYAAITFFGDMDGDEQVTNTDVVTLARVIVGLK